MGHALEFELLQGVKNWLNVDPGGPEQLFTDGAAQFLDMVGSVQLGLGKEDAPDQGVAVAVQAARGKANEHIPSPDRGSVDEIRLFTGAHGKPRQIIFMGEVKAWHFRRLSAD